MEPGKKGKGVSMCGCCDSGEGGVGVERGELRRHGRLVGLRAWLWVRFVLSSQLILEEGSTTSELWPVTWARVLVVTD